MTQNNQLANAASRLSNIARDGAEKKLTVPEIKPDMVRQTTGDLSPHHHGIAVDDEPNTTKTYVGEVPLNPGTHPSLTKSTQRGNRIDGEGTAQLQSAARLGRKA
jgi:hypothetical protein